MKTFATLIILLLMCFSNSFSQKQGNIWYFGDHAGVSFNSGSPVALTNGATYNNISYSEGTSVISDSSGILLFYSNGQKIWNQNHQVMSNGDGLLGNFSSTQSALIVPLPLSSRYFYLFTTDDYWENGLQYGLRYSVIDMCLDGALGGVVPSEKNILLLDAASERIAAARHSNGIDYWILTHAVNTDEFYAYLLTENGISDTVITHIGSVVQGAQGQLKISPDGARVALGSPPMPFQLFELFNFNNSSGILSDFKPIQRPYNGGAYGVEFSPDNSVLYAYYSSYAPIEMGIVQYNLNAGGGNVDSINSSMQFIYQRNIVTGRGLQLAPDGKIYSIGILDEDYLAVINYPNVLGTACDFQDSAVYLAGKFGSYCLPSFIAGYSYSNERFNCETGINEPSSDQDFILSPNPFTTSATITISQPGRFNFIMFDMLGREVKKIENRESKIVIERGNLPSGVYLYQIKEGRQLIGSGKVVVD